ncbi:MAG: pyrimidine/purine nucleoside phosphorylase [Verrucomicrobiota bacterium]
MSQSFENVSIVKKANVYFDGQVTSRTVLFADGTKKTLGFMQAGDYEFDTDAPELMEMLGGEMDVKVAGAAEWKTYREGDSFEVPGNSKFSLKVKAGGADYCCSYLSE